jgi:glucose 1-dehydrogenase
LRHCNTAYCLAKGGVRVLTRTAGVELAQHNILVVGVGPGVVATSINLSTMKDPVKLARLNAAIPLGAWRDRRRSPMWLGSSPETGQGI